MNRFVL